MSPWLQTASGERYDLLDPDPRGIRLRDVAHALARICRFTGAVLGDPYSVAQHSVLVALALRDEGHHPAIVRAGLAHDMHESVTGDVASPIKRAVGLAWDAFEDVHERAFAERFGLVLPLPPEVKTADLRMLVTEARDLCGGERGGPWGISAQPYGERILWAWDARTAEVLFLRECERCGIT